MESTLPTYLKIVQLVKNDIITGVLEPNEKLASIKELSQKYDANPNTVQRALAFLEKDGLIKSRRTAGKYVTDNSLLIKSIRNKEARKVTEDFISNLEHLGIYPEELVKLFTDPELAAAMGVK